MHGRQLGGNATETGGDRVDLHLFDGIGILTVRQVVGPQKAERQGCLQQQKERGRDRHESNYKLGRGILKWRWEKFGVNVRLLNIVCRFGKGSTSVFINKEL